MSRKSTASVKLVPTSTNINILDYSIMMDIVGFCFVHCIVMRGCGLGYPVVLVGLGCVSGVVALVVALLIVVA